MKKLLALMRLGDSDAKASEKAEQDDNTREIQTVPSDNQNEKVETAPRRR
jgi:hypothetical protein